MAKRTTPTSDLTGQTFGRLTVLGTDSITHTRTTLWQCRCQCGNTHTVRASHLIDGLTQSCGCLRREIYGDTSRVNNSPAPPRSGITGVRQKGLNWCASITIDGLTFDLDTYPSREEAIAIREEAEHHRTNFVPWYCEWLNKRTDERLKQKITHRTKGETQ